MDGEDKGPSELMCVLLTARHNNGNRERNNKIEKVSAPFWLREHSFEAIYMASLICMNSSISLCLVLSSG